MQEKSFLTKAYDTVSVILFFWLYWKLAGCIVDFIYGKKPKEIKAKYIYARQKGASQAVTFVYLLTLSFCVLVFAVITLPTIPDNVLVS